MKRSRLSSRTRRHSRGLISPCAASDGMPSAKPACRSSLCANSWITTLKPPSDSCVSSQDSTSGPPSQASPAASSRYSCITPSSSICLRGMRKPAGYTMISSQPSYSVGVRFRIGRLAWAAIDSRMKSVTSRPRAPLMVLLASSQAERASNCADSSASSAARKGWACSTCRQRSGAIRACICATSAARAPRPLSQRNISLGSLNMCPALAGVFSIDS
ncbi:Uncharacterised protein [Achromobacter xylosoxidans]|nr:Uncharacterised protein [Achromobacter xylosoxidans]